MLVGREMPNSAPWEGPWEAHRLKLAAHAGPRFYLSLQWELHRWLRTHASRLDAIWCNDLDTLAPAVWHGRLPVIYDSHEYFTEAAGLTGKPLKRSAWLRLERWAFKSLPCMITVNESIAESYRRTYRGWRCWSCATCLEGKRRWRWKGDLHLKRMASQQTCPLP